MSNYQYTYRQKHYYSGATKVRMETFDAAGTTLTKAYDYMAGMVYVTNPSEAIEANKKTLDFIGSPEGRAILTKKVLNLTADPTLGDKFRFEYSLKDHLGNLRVSCRCGDPKRDAQGIIIPEGTAGAGIEPLAVVQEQHYDPWGLAFNTTQAPPSGAGGADRFTYNGKELVTDLDLGWNDYGFRMYDATLGRWSAVDPLSDEQEDWSTYHYTFNNPINFIDEFGLSPDWWDQMQETMGDKWMREKGLNSSENRNKSVQELVESAWNKTPMGGRSTFKLSGAMWGELSIFEDEYGDFYENGTLQYWWRSIGKTGIKITRDNTAIDYLPIAGSLNAIQDANEQGNTKTAWFNGAMAISDVFLVKALASGMIRIGAGTAWKTGSHTWKATRSWFSRKGLAAKGQPVHHWFLHRNQGLGKNLPNWLKNQPWNTMNMPSKAAHSSVHNGSWMNYLWNGTPQWFKSTSISIGGRQVTND